MDIPLVRVPVLDSLILKPEPRDRPRLCVDFDDTIFDGYQLLPNCIDVLAELRKTYSIAVFSGRSTEAERIQMKMILDKYAVPYDEVLPPKPVAVAYIDDRGYKFDGWDRVPCHF